MVCKVCKRQTNEGEAICVLCQEVIHRHLGEARDYFNQYDLVRALEELAKVLEIDSVHQEAQNLKKQIQDRLKTIRELKLKVEECIQGNLYQEAAQHLAELLKLAPLDKEIQLHQQMLELVNLTDPATFTRKSRHKFQPSDWVNTNYNLPSGTIAVILASVFIIALSYVAANTYKSQFQSTPARDIYLKLRRIIDRKEYYSPALLSEYKVLMRDYGDTKYAQRLKKEFEKIIPKLVRLYIDRGKELYSQGRFREAIEEYSKVLAIDTFNKEVPSLIEAARNRLSLAGLLFPLSGEPLPRPPPVSVAVAEITKDMPEQAREYLIRGEQYFQSERYLEAITEWLKAYRLVPEQDRKKIQALIDRVRGLLADKEKEYLTIIDDAERYFKEQDLQAALDALERALKVSPGNAYMQERVNQIKYIISPPAMPRGTEAKNNLLSLLRSYLDYKNQENKKAKFKFYYQLAVEEEQAHNFLKANYYYKKAARYYEASLYIMKQIKANLLIVEIQKRLQQHPKDYNATFSLACLYYAKDWLPKAEELWNSLDAQDALGVGFLAHIFKAKVAEKKNQLSIAQGLYEQALKTEDIFYLHNSVAKLYWQQGFPEEAMRHWQSILSKRPFQLSAINSLANAHLLLGEPIKAQAALDTIVGLTVVELRRKQCYPAEVDPEYIIGLVSEKEYFYQATKELSQLYFDLGLLAESIRWRRISFQLEEKK